MALKRVKYIRKDGPPAVNILGLGVVKRGGTIDLPEEVAENLVSQRAKHFAYADGGGSKRSGKSKAGPEPIRN